MSKLRRSRWAINLVFAANGILVTTWAPHLPFLKVELSLSDSAIGLALLAGSIGAILGATLVAAPLNGHFGPDRVTRVATFAFALSIPLIITAESFSGLAAALFYFGFTIAIMDVAMNAIAADVEVAFKRPIMSSFHAAFSIGALAGAGVSSVAIDLAIDPGLHATVMTILVLAAVTWALAVLPPAVRTLGKGESKRMALPRGTLLVVGLIAMVVLMAEGAVLDWSAILIADSYAGTGWRIAAGLAAFQATMAVCRLAGDWVNSHIGPVALVRWGTALAAVGLGLAVTIQTPWGAIIGFAIMGIGLANTVPVVFTAAASHGRTSAEGLSSVAALGYAGFLIGPPATGFLSDLFTLPLALGIMAIACASVVPLARVAKPVRKAEPVATR